MIAETKPQVQVHDLGSLRKLSPETLQRFGVTVLRDSREWAWPAYTPSGKGQRRKSWYSTADAAFDVGIPREVWKKYRWYPDKPDDALLFSPGGLKDDIQAHDGEGWFTGGEIAVMTLYEVGITNATCFFGDGAVSNTLVEDLRKAGIRVVKGLFDRDKSGEMLARKIKTQLQGSEIAFLNYELPYPIADSHGPDVNDYWLGWQHSAADFVEALNELPAWDVPLIDTPVPKTIQFPGLRPDSYDPLYVPPRAIALVKTLLGIKDDYNSEGWTRHKVPCPFHGDQHASFDWNDQLCCGRCQSTCSKSFNVKQILEVKGYDIADYYDPPLHLNGNGSSSWKLIDLDALPEQTSVVLDEKNKPPTKQLRPMLPANVELTAEQRALVPSGRRWLDSYMTWAAQASSYSPPIMHEAVGLWLLAAIATRRICLNLPDGEVYPNLFICIVAPPVSYAKTTTMKLATKILSKAYLSYLRLPENSTPEALMNNLAGIQPKNFNELSERDRQDILLGRMFAAQRSILKDEISSILESFRREYMAGLEEIFLQGYDSNTDTLTSDTKGGGRVIIRNLSLSLLGATTPVLWSRNVGVEQQENGLAARFAVITPDCEPDEDAPLLMEAAPEPSALVHHLRSIFTRILPFHPNQLNSAGVPTPLASEEMEPPLTLSVTIDPVALQHLMLYRQAVGRKLARAAKLDDGKATAYGRLGTMAVKVAMLLALADGQPGRVHIRPQHVYAAQEVVERWRESLHRLDDIIANNNANDASEKLLVRIRQSGTEGVNIRELSRATHLNAKETRDGLSLLLAAQLIEIESRKATNKRTVEYYKLVAEPSANEVSQVSPNVTVTL